MLLIGLLFFAYKHHYIIFNFSSHHSSVQSQPIASNKKKVTLHYWHNDQWHQEDVFLLATKYAYNTLFHITSNYLQLLHNEGIIKHKIAIQKVLLHYDDHELFISFDQLPWHKEWCTQAKLVFIEGLLKTIKTNEPRIKKVRFLVHHQPMIDAHLDFSNAWPIEGFLGNN